MKNNIYIDANVILDLFDSNRKFHTHSKNLLERIIKDESIELFISSDMISNIFYILKNRFKLSLKKSIEIVEYLVKIFNIVTADSYDIAKAIDLCKTLKFTDYEDALQYVCALKIDARVLITNDKKGFKNSLIKTCQSNLALDFL